MVIGYFVGSKYTTIKYLNMRQSKLLMNDSRSSTFLPMHNMYAVEALNTQLSQQSKLWPPKYLPTVSPPKYLPIASISKLIYLSFFGRLGGFE